MHSRCYRKSAPVQRGPSSNSTSRGSLFDVLAGDKSLVVADAYCLGCVLELRLSRHPMVGSWLRYSLWEMSPRHTHDDSVVLAVWDVPYVGPRGTIRLPRIGRS